MNQNNITLTTKVLKDTFNKLNAMCFNNSLKCVPLKTHHQRYPYGETAYNGDKVKHISIASCYYYTQDLLNQLMLHEMIHVYVLRSHKHILFDHGFWYKLIQWKMKLKYGIDTRVKKMFMVHKNC